MPGASFVTRRHCLTRVILGGPVETVNQRCGVTLVRIGCPASTGYRPEHEDGNDSAAHNTAQALRYQEAALAHMEVADEAPGCRTPVAPADGVARLARVPQHAVSVRAT